MRPNGGISTAHVLLHLAAAALLAYFFVLSVRPLADSDLWWHLKSGQWMLEEKRLMGREDPFSFTTPVPLSDGQVRGLRSQWLGQVVLYLVYLLGGYAGLAVLRTVMITLPFLLMYVYYARRGLEPVAMLPVLCLPLLLLITTLNYTFERPQAFSFLMSLALVTLLERLRRPGGRVGWTALLAVLMALWSNLHGAFIFGVALIAVFAAGVVVEAAVYRKKEELVFLLPASVGLAASLLNPNGYWLLWGFMSGFVERLSGAVQTTGRHVDVVSEILEYKPLWFFYREKHYFWIPFMAAFMALAALAVVARCVRQRRAGFPELFTVATFISFGLYYARGVTFGLVVLPALVLWALLDLGAARRAAVAAVSAILCLAFVAVMVDRVPGWLKPSWPERWVGGSYPEGAVRFMERSGIRGPMFNELRWGGYLIWRTAPGRKVFMDSRLISGGTFELYNKVYGAGREAMGILDAFDVNLILIRVMSRETGAISPLVMRFLEEKPGPWRLLYLEGNTALFVRSSPRNRGVIKRYEKPLAYLYLPILDGAAYALSVTPGNPDALLSRAVALVGIGRAEEAGRILRALPPSPVRDRYLRRAGG